jgi:hypothetical protein
VEPLSPPVLGVPVAAKPTFGMEVVRHLDLLVLALALPVFLLIGAPILGYIVAAGAWIIGVIGKEMADRRRERALAERNRNAALGVTAAATMGRVWLLAGAILLVGLLADREAGLAAAVLAFVLVTAHLGAQFMSHLFFPEETV